MSALEELVTQTKTAANLPFLCLSASLPLHLHHQQHYYLSMLESYSARFVFSAVMTAAVVALQSVLRWLLLCDEDAHSPIDTESEDYRCFIAAEMVRLNISPAPVPLPLPPMPVPNRKRRGRAIKREHVSPVRPLHPRTPSPTPRARVKQEKPTSEPSHPPSPPPTQPQPQSQPHVPQPGDLVLRLRPSPLIIHNTVDAADLWDGPFEVASTTLQHWVELRIPAGSKMPAWTPVAETMPAPHAHVYAVDGGAEGGLYVVAKVRAVKGSVRGQRNVLVHWRGWGSEDDTWEPEGAVPKVFVREYEKRARRWEAAWMKT